MPLFEVSDDELVPFRRVQAGPELYEREVEDLLWQNLEAFVGRPLFPVARQAALGGGLIADVVALDRQGRVFIIEVKRDVDRRQLAQCLEYAGWARTTNLDELASLFHAGANSKTVERSRRRRVQRRRPLEPQRSMGGSRGGQLMGARSVICELSFS